MSEAVHRRSEGEQYRQPHLPTVDLIRAITNTPTGNQPDSPQFKASGPYVSFSACLVGGDGDRDELPLRPDLIGRHTSGSRDVTANRAPRPYRKGDVRIRAFHLAGCSIVLSGRSLSVCVLDTLPLQAPDSPRTGISTAVSTPPILIIPLTTGKSCPSQFTRAAVIGVILRKGIWHTLWPLSTSEVGVDQR